MGKTHKTKAFRPKRFFSINLEVQMIKGDTATHIEHDLKLTPKQMEKFLDSIPANKPNHISQKVKRKVWSWF